MAAHLQGAPPRVWDPVVRLSHWGIAAVVVGNGLLTQGGSVLHVWLGWIGLGFLVLRLLWGLVGPHEARFVSFPPNPRHGIAHLRTVVKGRPPEYRSHNPAGALMVYALWAMLAVVIATGLLMTGGETPFDAQNRAQVIAQGDWSQLSPDQGSGDQGSGDQGSGGEDQGEGGGDHAPTLLRDVHEAGANLLLILAVLHLGGVLVESVALRRNLVRPMILGQRKGADTPGE
ncbi:cytochrome b/b6 domain-containing protein [Acidimangrovimonas sediminis]|uniref:cytochrome b/b6 domain-containing protein n=1 Tax=Acidimangrovimonas sediminis TaxID=2056283 RepID=UPI000C803A30|nr:cytochrome b/b6 domain-containing protein [Acidimangrovimonas sediminis]